MNRWGLLNNWRNSIKSCGVGLWCNMGEICWGGHRGKAIACLKTNFITAESTTTASCWLALCWHYSCTASIVLRNPHCSHWGHTIVPAWYTVKALTSLWNKSMRQTPVNPGRALKPAMCSRLEKPGRPHSVGRLALAPYLIWAHMCSLIKCSSYRGWQG